MAAACACQPLFWVNDASVPATGMPASRCAVSSMLAPFCPTAGEEKPAHANASTALIRVRRFNLTNALLRFIGVLLPDTQLMSKTRVKLKWYLKPFAFRAECRSKAPATRKFCLKGPSKWRHYVLV